MRTKIKKRIGTGPITVVAVLALAAFISRPPTANGRQWTDCRSAKFSL